MTRTLFSFVAFRPLPSIRTRLSRCRSIHQIHATGAMRDRVLRVHASHGAICGTKEGTTGQ